MLKKSTYFRIYNSTGSGCVSAIQPECQQLSPCHTVKVVPKLQWLFGHVGWEQSPGMAGLISRKQPVCSKLTWGSPASGSGSVLHAILRPSVPSVLTKYAACALVFLSEWNTSRGPEKFLSGELQAQSSSWMLTCSTAVGLMMTL